MYPDLRMSPIKLIEKHFDRRIHVDNMHLELDKAPYWSSYTRFPTVSILYCPAFGTQTVTPRWVLYACFDRGSGITHFRLLRFLGFPLETVIGRANDIFERGSEGAEQIDAKWKLTTEKVGDNFKDVAYILHPDDNEHLYFDDKHYSNVDRVEGERILDEFIDSVRLSKPKADDVNNSAPDDEQLQTSSTPRCATDPFDGYKRDWMHMQFFPYASFYELPQGDWVGHRGILRTLANCEKHVYHED